MDSKLNTALLVCDCQTNLLGALKEDVQAEYIKVMADLIAFARESKIPVIYIKVGFRKNWPEISDKNKFFPPVKSWLGDKEPEIHADLAPKENEVVIIKKRFSAFCGSDLEVILRSMKVEHIVLAGISTSGVILSTTREAADKDFVITVLQDGCRDYEEENHKFLCEKIFPRQADVINIKDWKTKVSGK